MCKAARCLPPRRTGVEFERATPSSGLDGDWRRLHQERETIRRTYADAAPNAIAADEWEALRFLQIRNGG